MYLLVNEKILKHVYARKNVVDVITLNSLCIIIIKTLKNQNCLRHSVNMEISRGFSTIVRHDLYKSISLEIFLSINVQENILRTTAIVSSQYDTI